jgi:hypothetical protein
MGKFCPQPTKAKKKLKNTDFVIQAENAVTFYPGKASEQS